MFSRGAKQLTIKLVKAALSPNGVSGDPYRFYMITITNTILQSPWILKGLWPLFSTISQLRYKSYLYYRIMPRSCLLLVYIINDPILVSIIKLIYSKVLLLVRIFQTHFLVQREIGIVSSAEEK